MLNELAKSIDRESKSKEPGLKGFLYWWLENPNNKHLLIIDITINIIILASIYFIYLDYVATEGSAYIINEINDAFLIFFIIEYLLRFYVATDFFADWREKPGGSLSYAIFNKIRWMGQFFSIIDLLAILPAIRYLRILRTARLLRLLRAFRFLRVLKIFRHCEKYLLIFRGLTQSWRVYVFFFLATIGLVGVLSFGIYFFEVNTGAGKFESYSQSFMHSLKLLKLADDTPISFGGRTFSSLVLVGHVFFFAVIISLVTAQMRETMENIKKGNLGNIKLRNHIVLCGLTTSTRQVICDLLRDKKYRNNIVLITLKEDPDLKYIIYVHGDFSNPEVLASVNIGEADKCVIFAEARPNEDKKITDMRTMLTVFNIEKEFPEVHTICEIIFKENAEIIRSKIQGDEFIYKEVIDANLVNTCIKIPNITPLVYELLNCSGRQLYERKLDDFGFSSDVLFRDLKESAVQGDFVVLGIMQNGNKPVLAPNGDFNVNANDRIIVLG